MLIVFGALTIMSIAISDSHAASSKSVSITNKTDGGLKKVVDNSKSGTSIYLAKGHYNSNNTNILVNKSITIIGKGSARNVVIDAKNRGRFFNVGSKGKLTLYNITFVNGKVNGSIGAKGGAILSNGELTIKNCAFKNNLAMVYAYNNKKIYYSYGGAIYANGKLNINNAYFYNNSAQAIQYVANNTNNMNNSTNNSFISIFKPIRNETSLISAKGFGGCGGALYNNKGGYDIKNSKFLKNFASSKGGAIYNKKGQLSLFKTRFDKNFINTHAGAGGAIYNYGKIFLLKSKFFSNVPDDGIGLDYMVTCGPSYYGNGGAIANVNGTLNMKSSYFESNKATSGSAVYNMGKSRLNISNCNFFYCSSDSGAVYNSKKSFLNLYSSKFYKDGGFFLRHDSSIDNDGKAIIKKNSIFGAGYGIANSGSALVEYNIIKNSNLGINNYGNAIKIRHNKLINCSIRNGGSFSIIDNNTIINEGSAIANYGNSVVIKNNVIKLKKYDFPDYWKDSYYVASIVGVDNDEGNNVSIYKNKITAFTSNNKYFAGISNNGKAKIQSNTIKNVNMGVNNYGKSSVIAKNFITKSNKGVYDYNSKSKILSNKILRCSYGIYFDYYNSAKISKNKIFYNRIGITSDNKFKYENNIFKGNKIKFKAKFS